MLNTQKHTKTPILSCHLAVSSSCHRWSADNGTGRGRGRRTKKTRGEGFQCAIDRNSESLLGFTFLSRSFLRLIKHIMLMEQPWKHSAIRFWRRGAKEHGGRTKAGQSPTQASRFSLVRAGLAACCANPAHHHPQ
ncbi:hypothetical protein FQA47_005064 [Oryzias melastigma]|uniref:Uncharacterized protein n=1 Tax=Oryzias melastigma TaxID=30732 RepID=A0A834L3D7_ORYME|nr:hypothetical protein FQA47_005064 [Oryzias melastigma]